ncbi:hypothetical protein [Opitutus sp. GAS368]|jgi:hypothetical protein|uniref:hypothetical protein n=1 Tax=Opitutus sp. GAS368 TaxID=1882749 RepID=UPI000879DB09|nr:hypothetical protein [Opitutus sp. GAS368]SDS38858.1 hypothetical protein SAMN05444173_2750 [Opitutus sp. GAS368]
MATPFKTPTPRMWLADFKAILALSPVSADGVRELVYSRYPDAPWAEEYRFTIWHAYCYLTKHHLDWENLGLTVIGKKNALLKDSLLVALYTPFLSSPLETMSELDFPVQEIAERAHAIEGKSKRAYQ